MQQDDGSLNPKIPEILKGKLIFGNLEQIRALKIHRENVEEYEKQAVKEVFKCSVRAFIQIDEEILAETEEEAKEIFIARNENELSFDEDDIGVTIK